MNTNRSIVIIIFSIVLLGCGTKEPSAEIVAPEAASTPETVTLSDDQSKIIRISTTKPEERIMSDMVKAIGMLDVPPQNLVTISAPLGGFVSETNLLQGTRVKKGDIIVKLRHPDYIRLQQDYLENKSQLTFAEQEWKRQEDLAKENINAQKTLQTARTEYEKTKARHQALTASLKLTHLDGANIEKNGIQDEISIPSPISGFVTQVNVNLGMYAAPEQVMFKIVDTEHLHAEIQVFEKDILKIKPGQQIRFRLANETRERTAKVYLVGKEISEERTVRIHGHIDRHDPSLLPGMFLSAVIETGNAKSASLPESCFINFEGADYVFTETGKQSYQMFSISKGTCDSGFCTFAFNGPTPDGSVVMEGANTLLSLLKNREEE